MPFFCRWNRPFLGVFFINLFFPPNCRLSPVACHTILKSLRISGQFRLSGNNVSTSYEASEFCWQIVVNFLQHLRPYHIIFAVPVYVCTWCKHEVFCQNYCDFRYCSWVCVQNSCRMLHHCDCAGVEVKHMTMGGTMSRHLFALLTPNKGMVP